MPRLAHHSAVEFTLPLFHRKRKRGNIGSRSSAGLKSFSIVGRRYSASSSFRFSPFFSDRFERRGLVYVGSSIQHKTASDAVFAEYGFTWEAGNRITEFETVDGTAEYTYDKTGQLTGADYDYITDELYTYDDNGNRTNAGYVTGDNNETLSDGTYRYSYDAEGNRTEKFLWTDTNNDGIIDASEKTLVQTYNWDYRNRLESVTNYENGIAKEVIDYLYDYLNLMIERTVTDAATSALQSSDFNIYSNGQVVLEYDTTSAVDVVKSVNLWGANIDELAAVEQITQNINDSNVILWTYGDHLNSIRDVLTYDSITQTAAVVNHLIYNAFGILVSSTDGNSNNPASISPLLKFRYTGKYFDDSTGLQNNINRWYDNTTGKWLSVDPIGFKGGDNNLYRYVRNQSITIIDTNGLDSSPSVLSGIENNTSINDGTKCSKNELGKKFNPKLIGISIGSEAALHTQNFNQLKRYLDSFELISSLGSMSFSGKLLTADNFAETIAESPSIINKLFGNSKEEEKKFYIENLNKVAEYYGNLNTIIYVEWEYLECTCVNFGFWSKYRYKTKTHITKYPIPYQTGKEQVNHYSAEDIRKAIVRAIEKSKEWKEWK